ncbi:MAG: hypothetical protein ACI9XO_000232 [Paraglaciecola sp.]|jgi:hypothetical protein
MKYLFPILILVVLIVTTACDPEENFTTSSNDKLEFSLDTLRFDTVFTELGSTTRFFKVYNRSSKSIKINRMYIPDGADSKFRLNVDGTPGNEAMEVTIFPKDSIYVFGEVTVDPDDPLSASPFVINDKIIFETNGNTQEVILEAWGQNANYIPSRFSKDDVVTLSCDGGTTTWDDPKPYVIYGIVVIDNCNLVISAGAHIYVHGGLSKVEDMNETIIYNSGRLQISPTGSINVEGTLEDPVIFEGDRLEEGFADVSGQWTGIVFSPTSKNNSFEHAVIKNSLLGIWVDSAAELSLKSTQIYNTSGIGLVGIHAEITAENSLFYNNGSNSVLLTYGGDYDFKYCTMASYGVDAAALSIANGIRRNEFSLCAEYVANDLHANFENCIIHGSRRDEISLLDFSVCGPAFDFDYQFDNCIVKYDELTDPEFGFPNFPDNCINCLNASSSDTLFVSVSDDDYHLDTLSIAEEFAMPITGLMLDLEGKDRDLQMPDAGCYEYAPE